MLIFFFLTTLLFAGLATYFAFRYDRKISENTANEKEVARRVFELGLLSDITQKVGYSLNTESVAARIAEAVENLFELSTVSYAIVNEKSREIIIKTYRKENVNLAYTQSVSGIVFTAISSIEPKFSSYQMTEAPVKNDAQVDSSIPIDGVPVSYFNIPLVIDNEIRGMINISSRKKGVYQDSDMSLLYKLVNTAQTTISRLRSVIETEKGKLDSMILSLPTGAILFSLERGHINLSIINQAAKTFLKFDSSAEPHVEDVISKFGTDLKIVGYIKDVIQEKKSVILRNTSIFDKKFTIYITPVFDFSTGVVMGVSLTMRDMSLEESIEKIRADFTNMIVHDLRAPAVAIRGASNILCGDNLTREDEKKMLRVIADSSNNMMARISDILDVGKLSAGKLTIKKAKGNFAEFVRQHIDVFTYAAREKNIHVNFDVGEGISEFMFDSERIGQVINNLVSNSLKFTENNGKIDVRIWLENGFVTVMVRDTGIGIPESQKPFLFTKFGRIRQHGVGEGQSTGLGLFISKEIVAAHGGNIWVESPIQSQKGIEKGTAFYFKIPYAIEEKRDLATSHEFAN